MHRLLYILAPLYQTPAATSSSSARRVRRNGITLTNVIRSGRFQIRNFPLCGGNGRGLWLWPDGDAFGAHSLNIRDADEGKHRPEIGLLMFGRGCGGTFRIDTATRGRDDHALAAREPLDPLIRIREAGRSKPLAGLARQNCTLALQVRQTQVGDDFGGKLAG
jgi:hypothetical protein